MVLLNLTGRAGLTGLSGLFRCSVSSRMKLTESNQPAAEGRAQKGYNTAGEEGAD